MMNPELVSLLPGASELIEWLGIWPDFLDSEVTGLHLDRAGLCTLKILVFGPGNPNKNNVRDVSNIRLYLDRNVLVTFVLNNVIDCELAGFNHQNVINGLYIDQLDRGLRLTLHNVFGLGGTIDCDSARIEFEPVNTAPL